MRDRRREQRNRRVPAKSSRQARDRPATARKSPRRRRGAPSRNSCIAAALAPAAAASGCSAPATMSRKASANASKFVRVRQSKKISRHAQRRRVEPRGRRGEQSPQAMDAPGGAGGRVPAGVTRDVRRRAARKHPRAGAPVRRRRSAARRARRWRSAPANGGSARRIWSSRASPAPARKAASKPPSAPTAAFVGGRAQDGNACSNSGLAGAKLGAASRRDRRRGEATGASPSGSAAGVSSSKGSAGANRTMV